MNDPDISGSTLENISGSTLQNPNTNIIQITELNNDQVNNIIDQVIKDPVNDNADEIYTDLVKEKIPDIKIQDINDKVNKRKKMIKISGKKIESKPMGYANVNILIAHDDKYIYIENKQIEKIEYYLYEPTTESILLNNTGNEIAFRIYSFTLNTGVKTKGQYVGNVFVSGRIEYFDVELEFERRKQIFEFLARKQRQTEIERYEKDISNIERRINENSAQAMTLRGDKFNIISGLITGLKNRKQFIESQLLQLKNKQL